MPYIGNTIRAADDYRLIDDISSGFNGSETSFALQVAGSAPVPFPKSPQQVLISVNGVIQEPDPTGSSGFNLVGTNIVFSSAPTNGHAFFGIIYATADYLNAGGNFPAGSLGAPSITFIGDENTGLFRKSGGSVGFVSDATEIANFDSNGITISSGNIIIPDSIIHNGDTNTKIRFPAADTITAETGGTERQRINSDGQLLINQTASSGVGRQLQIGSNTGFGGVSLNRFSADTGSSGLDFIKSRNATIGSNTIVQNDDNLGAITWRGADGTDFATPAAQIKVAVDGTPGSNDMPGRIMLFTTADGASSLTERMRIDSSGDVGIGVTSIDSALHVYKQTNNRTARFQRISSQHIDITQTAGINSFTSTGKDFEIGTTDSQSFIFDTNGSERMRIDSSGRVGIGTSSPSDLLHINTTGTSNVGILLKSTSSTYPSIIGDANRSGASLFLAAFQGKWNGNRVAEVTLESGPDTTNKDDGIVVIRTRGDGDSSPQDRMLIDSTGNVGINDTSPTAELSVAATAPHIDIGPAGSTRMKIGYEGNNCFFGGTASTAMFIFKQNVDLEGHPQASGTERMRIDSSGNVGIGTTGVTNAKLAVNGRCHVDTTLTFGANSTLDGAVQATIYKPATNMLAFATAGNNERMRIDSSGRVGIGTSSPTASNAIFGGTQNCLMVAGSAAPQIRISSDTSNQGDLLLIAGNSGANCVIANAANGGDLLFSTNSSGAQGTRFQITDSGQCFMPEVFNRTSGSSVNMRIDSDGELRRATSSKRYKKDITDATWGLAELLKLKPITYKSNATGTDADDKTYGGFTAEDVHDIGLTEFVDYNENNEPDALAYGNMVSICVKAIQELTARVAALEAA